MQNRAAVLAIAVLCVAVLLARVWHSEGAQPPSEGASAQPPGRLALSWETSDAGLELLWHSSDLHSGSSVPHSHKRTVLDALGAARADNGFSASDGASGGWCERSLPWIDYEEGGHGRLLDGADVLPSWCAAPSMADRLRSRARFRCGDDRAAVPSEGGPTTTIDGIATYEGVVFNTTHLSAPSMCVHELQRAALASTAGFDLDPASMARALAQHGLRVIVPGSLRSMAFLHLFQHSFRNMGGHYDLADAMLPHLRPPKNKRWLCHEEAQQEVKLSQEALEQALEHGTLGAKGRCCDEGKQCFGVCVVTLPGPLIVFQKALSLNYYHFWADSGTHLLSAAAILRNDPSSKLLVYGKRQFALDALAALGVAPTQIVLYEPCVLYRAARVLSWPSTRQPFEISSAQANRLRSAAMAWLVAAQSAGLSAPKPAGVLLIGRGDKLKTHSLDWSKGMRSLVNAAEVELALQERFGGETVQSIQCTRPLLEQIHLFNNAQLVIGVEGACLTNVMFMKPRTSVLVNIVPAKGSFAPYESECGLSFFWHLAEVLEVEYHAFLVRESSWSDPVTVPIGRFKKFLARMLNK
jgi:capsular polysaccharide biosynthesis protein